jgi:dephospho-CoA kinase
MKKVIGITGSIGTGKSTVANKIAELGFKVIDCDEVNHNILEKNNIGYNKVVAEFGLSILDEELNLDRKKLGSIVFENKEKLSLLNQILHPLIYDKVKEEINSGEGFVFLNCPLLFETNFIDLCDYTIVVYVDLDTQIKRVMRRDHTDFPTTLKKINSQMPLVVKMEKADFIIDNCHSEGDLNWQIKQILFNLERMN